MSSRRLKRPAWRDSEDDSSSSSGSSSDVIPSELKIPTLTPISTQPAAIPEGLSLSTPLPPVQAVPPSSSSSSSSSSNKKRPREEELSEAIKRSKADTVITVNTHLPVTLNEAQKARYLEVDRENAAMKKELYLLKKKGTGLKGQQLADHQAAVKQLDAITTNNTMMLEQVKPHGSNDYKAPPDLLNRPPFSMPGFLPPLTASGRSALEALPTWPRCMSAMEYSAADKRVVYRTGGDGVVSLRGQVVMSHNLKRAYLGVQSPTNGRQCLGVINVATARAESKKVSKQLLDGDTVYREMVRSDVTGTTPAEKRMTRKWMTVQWDEAPAGSAPVVAAMTGYHSVYFRYDHRTSEEVQADGPYDIDTELKDIRRNFSGPDGEAKLRKLDDDAKERLKARLTRLYYSWNAIIDRLTVYIAPIAKVICDAGFILDSQYAKLGLRASTVCVPRSEMVCIDHSSIEFECFCWHVLLNALQIESARDKKVDRKDAVAVKREQQRREDQARAIKALNRLLLVRRPFATASSDLNAEDRRCIKAAAERNFQVQRNAADKTLHKVLKFDPIRHLDVRVCSVLGIVPPEPWVYGEDEEKEEKEEKKDVAVAVVAKSNTQTMDLDVIKVLIASRQMEQSMITGIRAMSALHKEGDLRDDEETEPETFVPREYGDTLPPKWRKTLVAVRNTLRSSGLTDVVVDLSTLSLSSSVRKVVVSQSMLHPFESHSALAMRYISKPELHGKPWGSAADSDNPVQDLMLAELIAFVYAAMRDDREHAHLDAVGKKKLSSVLKDAKEVHLPAQAELRGWFNHLVGASKINAQAKSPYAGILKRLRSAVAFEKVIRRCIDHMLTPATWMGLLYPPPSTEGKEEEEVERTMEGLAGYQICARVWYVVMRIAQRNNAAYGIALSDDVRESLSLYRQRSLLLTQNPSLLFLDNVIMRQPSQSTQYLKELDRDLRRSQDPRWAERPYVGIVHMVREKLRRQKGAFREVNAYSCENLVAYIQVAMLARTMQASIAETSQRQAYYSRVAPGELHPAIAVFGAEQQAVVTPFAEPTRAQYRDHVVELAKLLRGSEYLLYQHVKFTDEIVALAHDFDRNTDANLRSLFDKHYAAYPVEAKEVWLAAYLNAQDSRALCQRLTGASQTDFLLEHLPPRLVSVNGAKIAGYHWFDTLPLVFTNVNEMKMTYENHVIYNAWNEIIRLTAAQLARRKERKELARLAMARAFQDAKAALEEGKEEEKRAKGSKYVDAVGSDANKKKKKTKGKKKKKSKSKSKKKEDDDDEGDEGDTEEEEEETEESGEASSAAAAAVGTDDSIITYGASWTDRYYPKSESELAELKLAQMSRDVRNTERRRIVEHDYALRVLCEREDPPRTEKARKPFARWTKRYHQWLIRHNRNDDIWTITSIKEYAEYLKEADSLGTFFHWHDVFHVPFRGDANEATLGGGGGDEKKSLTPASYFTATPTPQQMQTAAVNRLELIMDKTGSDDVEAVMEAANRIWQVTLVRQKQVAAAKGEDMELDLEVCRAQIAWYTTVVESCRARIKSLEAAALAQQRGAVGRALDDTQYTLGFAPSSQIDLERRVLLIRQLWDPMLDQDREAEHRERITHLRALYRKSAVDGNTEPLNRHYRNLREYLKRCTQPAELGESDPWARNLQEPLTETGADGKEKVISLGVALSLTASLETIRRNLYTSPEINAKEIISCVDAIVGIFAFDAVQPMINPMLLYRLGVMFDAGHTKFNAALDSIRDPRLAKNVHVLRVDFAKHYGTMMEEKPDAKAKASRVAWNDSTREEYEFACRELVMGEVTEFKVKTEVQLPGVAYAPDWKPTQTAVITQSTEPIEPGDDREAPAAGEVRDIMSVYGARLPLHIRNAQRAWLTASRTTPSAADDWRMFPGAMAIATKMCEGSSVPDAEAETFQTDTSTHVRTMLALERVLNITKTFALTRAAAALHLQDQKVDDEEAETRDAARALQRARMFVAFGRKARREEFRYFRAARNERRRGGPRLDDDDVRRGMDEAERYELERAVYNKTIVMKRPTRGAVALADEEEEESKEEKVDEKTRIKHNPRRIAADPAELEEEARAAAEAERQLEQEAREAANANWQAELERLAGMHSQPQHATQVINGRTFVAEFRENADNGRKYVKYVPVKLFEDDDVANALQTMDGFGREDPACVYYRQLGELHGRLSGVVEEYVNMCMNHDGDSVATAIDYEAPFMANPFPLFWLANEWKSGQRPVLSDQFVDDETEMVARPPSDPKQSVEFEQIKKDRALLTLYARRTCERYLAQRHQNDIRHTVVYMLDQTPSGFAFKLYETALGMQYARDLYEEYGMAGAAEALDDQWLDSLVVPSRLFVSPMYVVYQACQRLRSVPPSKYADTLTSDTKFLKDFDAATRRLPQIKGGALPIVDHVRLRAMLRAIPATPSDSFVEEAARKSIESVKGARVARVMREVYPNVMPALQQLCQLIPPAKKKTKGMDGESFKRATTVYLTAMKHIGEGDDIYQFFRMAVREAHANIRRMARGEAATEAKDQSRFRHSPEMVAACNLYWTPSTSTTTTPVSAPLTLRLASQQLATQMVQTRKLIDDNSASVVDKAADFINACQAITDEVGRISKAGEAYAVPAGTSPMTQLTNTRVGTDKAGRIVIEFAFGGAVPAAAVAPVAATAVAEEKEEGKEEMMDDSEPPLAEKTWTDDELTVF